MKKVIVLLLAGLLSMLACSVPASTAKVRIVTPENPPYNYTDDKGQLVGSSTEIVRAMLKKMGQDIPIELMLWEDAYVLAQKEPNVALYSTTRTPMREELFQWVGPLTKSERWLYAKKGSGIKLNSIADIKNGKTIAGVKEDSGTQYCLAQGGKLVYAADNYDALKKVMDGSADLTAAGADISYVAKKAGLNADDFERVLLIDSYDLYIAFSRNTPAAVVKQWQQALDSVKK